MKTDILADAEDNTRPKYSHGEDYALGRPNQKGMTHAEDKSSFSKKDKIQTGLTVRQPL